MNGKPLHTSAVSPSLVCIYYMRSMTGYGSGRSTTPSGGQCGIEIQSVNRKQSELQINLPRELSPLEGRVRESVASQVTRGRLVVSVSFQARGAVSGTGAGNGTTPPPVVSIDTAMARAYYQSMLALQKELGAGGEVSIESVLRAPGVMRQTEEPIAPDEVWPHLESALKQALAELIAMRAREGQHLALDLRARLDEMLTRIAEIRRRQPDVVEHHRRTLYERLQRAKLDVPLDDDRLLKELVLFASRADISEEVTRLDSHLEQFSALLKKDEPVSRALDFLAQEIARELNTLGAKANDLAINQLALACKTELDKIREQIQNVE